MGNFNLRGGGGCSIAYSAVLPCELHYNLSVIQFEICCSVFLLNEDFI